jgi:DNA polymerase-3 subunit delta
MKPIYVICGSDPALVGQRYQELIDELLDPDQRALALFSVDGKDATASQILDEVRTLPLLTQRKVVVVRDAGGFVSANRGLLEDYFDAPCPSGALILTVETWQANTKLAKKLATLGELISVTAPKPWEMSASLVQLAAKRHAKKLTQEAADLLVQLIGDDWAQVCNELDKLVLFVDQERVVSADHVEQLAGHNRVFGAFDVIDGLTRGETGRAIQQLRAMFDQNKAAEYTVVGAFAFHVRRLFQAKALLAKGANPAAVAKELHLFWKVKDSFMAQVQRLSLEQIASLLATLAEIDYQVKTGQARTEVAIERLVLTMGGMVRPQAAGPGPRHHLS